jgi:MHS family proline/betaine transporter-like MFS transporter
MGATAIDSSHRTRIILGGIAGNLMEWYDFALYGYFAAIIGRQFFPSEDPAGNPLKRARPRRKH